MPGNSSWMPYAAQRVKGFDDDDDDDTTELLYALRYILFCVLCKQPDDGQLAETWRQFKNKMQYIVVFD